MSGCSRGHQPRNRGSRWMSSVRYEAEVSSIAPSIPWVRGSGPIAAISSSVMPETRKRRKPPSPSGIPSAAYRAPTSSRAELTSRWRTSSTDSCEATASTASLTAFSAGLRVSGTRGTIALSVMPRFWYWTAAVATVFVFAGMVIAITKLV